MMKKILAIICSYVILMLGWAILLMIMQVIGKLVLESYGGPMFIHWINAFIAHSLSPLYGGFLATFITPKLFKSIDVKIIYLGVFWFAMFWIIIGGAFKFYYMNHENFSDASIYGSIILIGGHVVVIAGAKIGALFHVK